MGLTNHVLDGGPDTPREEEILRAKGRPVVKYMKGKERKGRVFI